MGAGGKLLLMAGQLDTTNYMDHNAYANSHNNNLTNSVFGNNPVLPLTDNSWDSISRGSQPPPFT